MLRQPTFGTQALAPPRSAAPVGPFQKPPLAPPSSAEPNGPYGTPPLAPPRSAEPLGPYGMLMSAPPALIFPRPEHAVPSAFTHGGGGGGSAMATGAATAAAAAAAPANDTSISRAIFAIMILVYHESGECGSSAEWTLLPRACAGRACRPIRNVDVGATGPDVADPGARRAIIVYPRWRGRWICHCRWSRSDRRGSGTGKEHGDDL